MLDMILLWIRFFVFAVLISSTLVHADQSPESDQSVETVKQSSEAIALDEKLYKEMSEYEQRFREFRGSLRAKYPRGEDRIAALEQWEKEHEVWNEDWERRRSHLDEIWNWGSGGEAEPQERVDDLSTASGRITAAVGKIRRDEKGTGKAGSRIIRWMEANKQLVAQAEDERVSPPVPARAELTGLSEPETEYITAKNELQSIRAALLRIGGVNALKAAVRNPSSEYWQKKQITNEKHREMRIHKQNILEPQPETTKP